MDTPRSGEWRLFLRDYGAECQQSRCIGADDEDVCDADVELCVANQRAHMCAINAPGDMSDFVFDDITLAQLLRKLNVLCCIDVDSAGSFDEITLLILNVVEFVCNRTFFGALRSGEPAQVADQARGAQRSDSDEHASAWIRATVSG